MTYQNAVDEVMAKETSDADQEVEPVVAQLWSLDHHFQKLVTSVRLGVHLLGAVKEYTSIGGKGNHEYTIVQNLCQQ